MRRVFPLLLLIVFAVPSTVSAASSRPYVSSRYGFSLRYPRSWRASATNQLGVEQIVFASEAKQPYSLILSILPVKPGKSIQETRVRFLRYEQRAGNGALRAIRWSRSTIDRQPAVVGVMTPPTEGGVAISQALYVLGWRSHIFQIVLSAYVRHALTRVSQFPSVYRQIVGTWRFR